MLKFFTIIIILVCVLIIVSFFMPWVSGSGSILKPLDKATEKIQNIDFTGVTKKTVKTAKKISDVFIQLITKKKLEYNLRGFQIPLVIYERVGMLAYSLYIIPLVAILSCWFVILGNRKRYFDLIVVSIAFILFTALYKQIEVFNQEDLFINIKECWGFRVTLYLFPILGILALIKFIIQPFRERTSFPQP